MDSDGSERHVELGLYSHVSSKIFETYKLLRNDLTRILE
jgi:hypothetical protein